MAKASFTIDRRKLMTELNVSSSVLKRVADEGMEKSFFLPAVEQMKQDFEASPVTRELEGGLDASNESNTLDAPFREDEDDTVANLWGFIGFEGSPEEVLAPIRDRLEPSHRDGPKMVFAGREADKMTYKYEIQAPNEDSIYDNTPLPWLERGGPSWIKRIEQGIPGIGHFLNVSNRPGSRSGGGVQIEGTLRSGRFKPVKYFSQILNNFLRVASGRTPSERRGFRD